MADSGPTTEIEPAAGGFPTPVVWLFGKVQSGKTSIIRALTGVQDAAIGDGFRACTRTSAVYDFPTIEPVIRFLDTRGVGEARYDPGEDIALCRGSSHLMLCTMRAMDHQQSAVVEAVREVRRAHSEWPIIIAQTTLHEGYGGRRQHSLPYAFDENGLPDSSVPIPLSRSILAQRDMFKDIAGKAPIHFVPIDFTRPEDGMDPQNYGLDALKRALAVAAPLSISAALADEGAKAGDVKARQAHSRIIGHATAAAASDIFPLVGIVTVPGIQAKMLASLAGLYGLEWNRRTAAELAGALGTGTLVRMAGTFGARELLKLIPLYGQTIAAAGASAASFASTYALGKAAVYYLGRRHLGDRAKEGVLEAYKAAFATAFGMARIHDARAETEKPA